MPFRENGESDSSHIKFSFYKSLLSKSFCSLNVEKGILFIYKWINGFNVDFDVYVKKFKGFHCCRKNIELT